MRRKGIVGQRWQGFIERFGDFEIEAPVSEAMQSFLVRRGTPAQKEALHLTVSQAG